MDLTALIAGFRQQAGDHATPPLFPDADVIGWLNEAEHEACGRARLLYDRTTADVTQIALVQAQREYRLDPSVIDVESVSLLRPGAAGQIHLVNRVGREDMDWSLTYRPNLAGWANTYYAYGDGDEYEGRHLVLDRVPNEAGGVLRFAVYRYPLQSMEQPSDEPEINPRHHPFLIEWALYRAYQTRDMEGSSPGRSDRHLANFAARFGELIDENVKRKQLRHRAPVVRAIEF